MVVQAGGEKEGGGLLSSAANAKIIGRGSETMVLAHGFGGNQSLWHKVVPKLSEHYQILLFDWNFSGAITDTTLFDPSKYSSYTAFAEDLIALMEELNLKSTIFVGHSMSGLVGCIAYTKSPHLFQRLVLVCASPRYINTDDYEGGYSYSDIEQIIATMKSNYQSWAANFASQVVDSSDPMSLAKIQKCLQEMRPEVAVPLANTVFTVDEREVLEKVDVPCTIIRTKTDCVVPTSVATYMQKKIEGISTVEVINTNGHFPHLTAHQEFLQVLGAVLGF